MQWERYRLFVRHYRSDGQLSDIWLDDPRDHERDLGREGWRLISVSALVDDDGALVEILWYERPIASDAPPSPEKGPLGFASFDVDVLDVLDVLDEER